MLCLSETPGYLLKSGKEDKAKASLARIFKPDHVEEKF
jgi:hypothetical protein